MMNFIENHRTFCEPSKIRKIPILSQKSSIRKHGHLGTFCQRTFQNKFCSIIYKMNVL